MSNSNTSSNWPDADPAAITNTEPSPVDLGVGTENKPPERTISCVSCRKRKLRCDRVKPQCATCTRLGHECEYPERRRNPGSKRRNMKELEARLAQVETRLVSEVNASNTRQKKMPGTTGTSTSAPNIETDWDSIAKDLDLDLDLDTVLDPSFHTEPFEYRSQPTPQAAPAEVPLSQELISLGLDEPLPPAYIIDELHKIYFERYHPSIPMMHKYRYLASFDRAPNMRPPICLRYAIWATAAALTDKYESYEDIFYKRARKYVEAAEMKGYGETFVSLYHAQTWGLIAHYEAKKTYFSRSWMSTGRMVRMVHMLGLHRLDGDASDTKQILPPPRDWIEKEERRRTFWGAFYGDRWASSGTGWPMIINEEEIHTNLPCSDESFEMGSPESSVSLADALTPDGARYISPFGGVILSATLFGHNFQHLHQSGPNEQPENIAEGEFWKRHRKMDNVLSNTFLFLPENLRMPGGRQDMNVIFLHMNIHASIICLHQAALLTAERHNLDPEVIRQSRRRSLTAAQEIANIMRIISHVDASLIHSWMGFCLYVAAGVCLHNATNDEPSPQSSSDLHFILSAMNALGKKHNITKHFTAQLELDIEASGIENNTKRYTCRVTEDIHGGVPSIPMNGMLASRNGQPMTVDEMAAFSKKTSIWKEPLVESIFAADNTLKSDTRPDNVRFWNVQSVEYASSKKDTPPLKPFVPQFTPMMQLRDLASASCPRGATPRDPSCPFSKEPPLSAVPRDSSNTMQFPFRQAEQNPEKSWLPSMGYHAPPNGWDKPASNSSDQFNDYNQSSAGLDALLDGIDWTLEPDQNRSG